MATRPDQQNVALCLVRHPNSLGAGRVVCIRLWLRDPSLEDFERHWTYVCPLHPSMIWLFPLTVYIFSPWLLWQRYTYITFGNRFHRFTDYSSWCHCQRETPSQVQAANGSGEDLCGSHGWNLDCCAHLQCLRAVDCLDAWLQLAIAITRCQQGLKRRFI